MLKKFKSLLLMMSLVALAGLAGCTGSKSEQDDKITENVNTKFSADPIVGPVAMRITVNTQDGVVTLIGTVDTGEQEQKAKEVAGSVDGVKRVDSTLKVEPKASSTTSTTTTTTTSPSTQQQTTTPSTTPVTPSTDTGTTESSSPAAPQQQQ